MFANMKTNYVKLTTITGSLFVRVAALDLFAENRVGSRNKYSNVLVQADIIP